MRLVGSRAPADMTEDQAKRLRVGQWVRAIGGQCGMVLYRDVAVCEIHWYDGVRSIVQHWNMAGMELDDAPMPPDEKGP